MVLLHGFIKAGRKTPQKDLRLAKDRLKKFDRNKQVVIQKNDSVTLGTIKKAAHFLGKRVTLQLV